jgi:hypothetical protein
MPFQRAITAETRTNSTKLAELAPLGSPSRAAERKFPRMRLARHHNASMRSAAAAPRLARSHLSRGRRTIGALDNRTVVPGEQCVSPSAREQAGRGARACAGPPLAAQTRRRASGRDGERDRTRQDGERAVHGVQPWAGRTWRERRALPVLLAMCSVGIKRWCWPTQVPPWKVRSMTSRGAYSGKSTTPWRATSSR